MNSMKPATVTMNRGISSLKSLRFISQPSRALASHTPSPLKPRLRRCGRDAFPLIRSHSSGIPGGLWRGLASLRSRRIWYRCYFSTLHLAKIVLAIEGKNWCKNLRNLELSSFILKKWSKEIQYWSPIWNQKTLERSQDLLSSGHPGVDGNVSSAILEVSSQADFWEHFYQSLKLASLSYAQVITTIPCPESSLNAMAQLTYPSAISYWLYRPTVHLWPLHRS